MLTHHHLSAGAQIRHGFNVPDRLMNFIFWPLFEEWWIYTIPINSKVRVQLSIADSIMLLWIRDSGIFTRAGSSLVHYAIIVKVWHPNELPELYATNPGTEKSHEVMLRTFTCSDIRKKIQRFQVHDHQRMDVHMNQCTLSGQLRNCELIESYRK